MLTILSQYVYNIVSFSQYGEQYCHEYCDNIVAENAKAGDVHIRSSEYQACILSIFTCVILFPDTSSLY